MFIDKLVYIILITQSPNKSLGQTLFRDQYNVLQCTGMSNTHKQEKGLSTEYLSSN